MMEFYSGKRVLITGHTGFKGTWLTQILVNLGAEVCGYSRCSEKEESLFEMTNLEKRIKHVKGDVRDFEHLRSVFDEFQPEIVFHLAAQPIVKEGYSNPVYTYETNVMGTVNLMECVRRFPCVKSVLNVTTDKVYNNNEWCWGYREADALDGFDPYSNSKSCSELITHCYKRSFFSNTEVAISTVRAGNVIGGGDFAKDRIIPDCIRAVRTGETILVRNPNSVRPYQHVLEPLAVYLLITQCQYNDLKYQDSYNIGPDDCDCLTTGELVNLFCKTWGKSAIWRTVSEEKAPHEAGLLRLDSSKLKTVFAWKPRWHIEESVYQVCKFTKVMMEGGDISSEMNREIKDFFGKSNEDD